MKHIKVAVTGVGPVSPIGTGREEFWKNLTSGRSGTRALARLAPLDRGCKVVAEVAEPAFKPVDPLRPVGRATELALRAANLAWTDARVDVAKSRIGVVVGSSIGNADVVDSMIDTLNSGGFLSPGTAFNTFAHAAACEIARTLDIRGPIQTVTSGCNAGADAIGLAFDWIRVGRADAVLVGGAEGEISRLFMQSMQACKALGTRHNASPEKASRPFDRKRDGNIPGEGAGFLLLERLDLAEKRGATVRALLSSYASSAVGERQYDPFNPDLNPEHMSRNLALALELGGLTGADLSAVSANGSSSVLYDPMESHAIYGMVANSTTPVYSIKGAIGQTGACTSALQALGAVLSLEHKMIPPTVNLDELDPACAPLNYVRQATPAREMKHVLCNAIGFGGFYYSALVFSSANLREAG